MDDPELEEIRRRRMQEMMKGQQAGGGAGAAAGGMGGAGGAEQQQAEAEQKREAEERRQMMLVRSLSNEARERLSRIALVKPDKARGVEDLILRGVQYGQIREKVSEEKLITLLEQINEQTKRTTKVTIQRRRSVLDDDA
eukprot:TRINITY_DN2980_c0_g1_i2.p2 TRINITY_DN2980_c0_g1~~TRINITY_DN2980_c0_g1_i2.p2  ORF type:complete len:140 (+),score=49.19 TRINITY_DN2980_c0_g1_i2:272-691(+)